MPLRCLIVDDNQAFLDVAATSLSGEDLVVLGTATTTADALAQVAELAPDVVLVDINLGEESGFDLARRLVDEFPRLSTGVVLISSRAEQDFGSLIDASSAAGFVSKKDLSAAAIREVVASRPPSALEGT